MPTESIYPKLENIENTPLIRYHDISVQVEKNLSDARIKEIQGKRNEMEKSLKHYKKIMARWKKVGNIVKYSSIVIVAGCGIAMTVLGFGAFATPLIVGIVSTCGIGEGIISEAFVFVVKKKTIRFKKTIQHVQEYISKSWYLFEKIREDGIITLKELDEFRMLMDSYEKGLKVESRDDDDNEYTIKLRESLRSKAQKEVRKELKLDLMNDLKNELKEKILQKVT